MAEDDDYGLTPATATATKDDQYGLEEAQPARAPIVQPASTVTEKELPGATPQLLKSVNAGKSSYTPPTGFEKARPQVNAGEAALGMTPTAARATTNFDIAALSGASGLKPTLHPIYDTLYDKGPQVTPGQKLGENIGSLTLGPLAPMAQGLYSMGKEIISPEGRNDEEREESRGTALGRGAGQLIPMALGEAAGETLPGARQAAAEHITGGLVRRSAKQAEKDIRFGQDPEGAIANEGIVAGSKQGVVQAINNKLTELHASLDNVLKGSPGANTPIDAVPIIDKNIDTAIQAARKVGNDGAEARLEKLRQALKTQHGPVNGTPYEMNQLKRSIGDAAADLGAFKATDPIEASAASAMGDIYRDINDAVSKAVPEARELNGRSADLIGARMGVNRNIYAEEASHPGIHSLTHGISRIAESTLGSAPVRTGLARILNTGNINEIPEPLPARPTPLAPPPPAPGPAAPPFQLQNLAPNQSSLWQQQVGHPPGLTWGGEVPNPEKLAPIGQSLSEARTSPPPVQSQYKLEPIGNAADEAALGTRGAGGIRVNEPKLLPAPAVEASQPEVSNAPPSVQTRFKLEPIGNAPTNENALGPRGEGGVRVPEGSRLLPPPSWRTEGQVEAPASAIDKGITPQIPTAGRPEAAAQSRPVQESYSPEELDNARLMVESELGMLRSADKPGRYFVENEGGQNAPQTPKREQNAERGVFAAGRWMGIKSLRTMLPWFRENSFSPGEVERALKAGEGPMFQKIMRNAAEFEKRRGAGEAAERDAIQNEDRGEGDVNFMPEEETAAPKRVQITTDTKGIRWAKSPDGYQVSIPKNIPDEQAEEYAEDRLAEQARIHGEIKGRF